MEYEGLNFKLQIGEVGELELVVSMDGGTPPVCSWFVV